MKSGSRKAKRFLGYAMTKRDVAAVVSLIEKTAGRFGLHKRYFKTEETFWKAISLITGLSRQSDETFYEAVMRIRGSVCRRAAEDRNAMIEAIDRRAFFEAVGVSLTETVTFQQIQSNARRHGQTLRDPTKSRKSPTVSAKDEFYKSWEWRTLRMEALQEHGRACQCCGAMPGMKDAAGNPVRICVDHIKPISKYWALRLERTNLQILCDECNQGKGNWNETDFRPSSAPDEWIVDADEISDAIREQLMDRTTGRLQ